MVSLPSITITLPLKIFLTTLARICLKNKQPHNFINDDDDRDQVDNGADEIAGWQMLATTYPHIVKLLLILTLIIMLTISKAAKPIESWHFDDKGKEIINKCVECLVCHHTPRQMSH